MHTTLTKAFLVALPLAGLLFTAPAAFAKDHRHHHHCWSNRSDRASYSQRWQERRRYHENHYRSPAERFDENYYRSPAERFDENYALGSYARQSSRYSPWSGRVPR